MNVFRRAGRALCVLAVLLAVGAARVHAEDPWVVYEGGDGPGKGKHIVLVSGDEEYRSEEALPQLGKILATHHGFTCTVLFAVHPDGHIDPNFNVNIPGLAALDDADLMVIFTRFRDLPDDQMNHIDAYLKSGKPVIGLRTSTHAFNADPSSDWYHYSNGYPGEEEPAWTDGFGRIVLGEKWISHHGAHKTESTNGVVAPGAEDHPIVRGIEPGSMWGATDVYGVRLPLPGDSKPIVLGQVMAHEGAFDAVDLHYGMRPDNGTPVEGEKNDPMMPIAWTKSYQLPDGEKGTAFTSTIGSSTDLLSEGVRRLIANAVYWSLDMAEAIPEDGTNVDRVGSYEPTRYEFRDSAYWEKRNMTIDEHRMANE